MIIVMKTIKEGRLDWPGDILEKWVREGLSFQVPFELSPVWCKWASWGRSGGRANCMCKGPEVGRGLCTGRTGGCCGWSLVSDQWKGMGREEAGGSVGPIMQGCVRARWLEFL